MILRLLVVLFIIGSGTRNEYRLTRLGKNFPFFQEDNVGDLIIICQIDSDDYSGFILSADEDIEDFLASLVFHLTRQTG